MRINKYIALATGMSRRAADSAIENGRVMVDNQKPQAGADVGPNNHVTVDGQPISPATKTTILLNKPVGYVCSRTGQGSKTIYDLLPDSLHNLKPVGRLDKDSSGLLLVTNDGDLANFLTHPRFVKEKTYIVQLNKPLRTQDQAQVSGLGVKIDDKNPSVLQIIPSDQLPSNSYYVVMSEGRNRQIRRTFDALGYEVTKLHRIKFGPYSLGDLKPGKHQII